MVLSGIQPGAPNLPASGPAAERPDVRRRSVHSARKAQFENGERQLDFFEYILIITSVIYAMAVAQILSGVSRLAQSPGTIRPYLAHTVWVFVLFIYIFIIWWATWEFRLVEWTFPRYLYMLVAPTLLFFACSLLVPQSLPERDADLEAHFFRIRRPLLWSFLLTTAAIIVDGNVLGDEEVWHRGRIGHAILIGVPVCGLYTANRRAHNAISIIVGLALTMVVVMRFWTPR